MCDGVCSKNCSFNPEPLERANLHDLASYKALLARQELIAVTYSPVEFQLNRNDRFLFPYLFETVYDEMFTSLWSGVLLLLSLCVFEL